MNWEKIRQVALAVTRFVAALVIPIVAAALLKGEPLKGLAKLESLLRLLKTGVPLWVVLLLIIACVWMLPSAIRNALPKQPKLHVSWERISCVWALGRFGTQPMMQIQGDAIVTSSNTQERVILREGYIVGTKPLMSLGEQLHLMPDEPLACRLLLFVSPVLRKSNEDLVAELILIDHKNRKHKIGQTTFRSGNPKEKGTATSADAVT